MRLLKRNGRHLAPLEEKPFKLERDLQKLDNIFALLRTYLKE